MGVVVFARCPPSPAAAAPTAGDGISPGVWGDYRGPVEWVAARWSVPGETGGLAPPRGAGKGRGRRLLRGWGVQRRAPLPEPGGSR